ncbi:MAG: ABC transporter substrate-binding protein [Acidimicrobiales bacterium]
MVALTALAGCGQTGGQRAATTGSIGGHGDSAGHTPPRLVAQPGGDVTVAVDQVPTTLNDHTAAGDDPSTAAVAGLVLGQVFVPDARLVPRLDVGTSVVDSAEVVNLNPQTVVYQIDPKALWSDGTPVSANDFVYNWLAQSGTGHDIDGSPDSVAADAGYSDISSVVGSNAGRTVTVVFQSPYADWESLFGDLIPAHIAEKVGWNHGFDSAAPVVSAGPWTIQSWQPGTRMVLVHNPRWWGVAPSVSQITLVATPGAPATALALNDGTAQVAALSSPDPQLGAMLTSNPELQSHSQLGASMLQLVFDTKRPPLDDVNIRAGIAHYIDRAAIVEKIVQPIDPQAWEDNNHLFANVEQPYSDDATGYETADVQAAGDDLVNGGFTQDANGTWQDKGQPVTLTMAWAKDDPWSSAVGPVIAAELVAAGFDVDATPAPSSQLAAQLPTGTFDLALEPVQATAYPSQLGAVFGALAPGQSAGAGVDWAQFDDPKIDKLFTQAAAQLGANQEQPLYQQIDADLWAEMPTLPLFAEPDLIVWSAALQFVPDGTTPGGVLAGASKWAMLQAVSGAP